MVKDPTFGNIQYNLRPNYKLFLLLPYYFVIKPILNTSIIVAYSLCSAMYVARDETKANIPFINIYSCILRSTVIVLIKFPMSSQGHNTFKLCKKIRRFGLRRVHTDNVGLGDTFLPDVLNARNACQNAQTPTAESNLL